MQQNLISTHDFGLFDQMIAQQGIRPLSLNPRKNLITSFEDIGGLIAERTDDAQIIQCLYNTVERILHAQLVNFPENIFWDFDLMICNMLEQAIIADDKGTLFLESFGNKLVELMELFGFAKEIRFRYVHDFMYGFDWARWVKKEPEKRAKIKLFSLTFLDNLLSKGKAILQLISVDDAQYHHISTQSYRNPFCFSRDPEHEYRLLKHLASDNLIPVATWNWNASPIWNKPFDQIREELSSKLLDGL
jgi:hypothetical protein